LEVDQIDFKKPVDIGDLVRLRSRGEVRVTLKVTVIALACAGSSGMGCGVVQCDAVER
jgi:acyl-CoA hydrolase